LFYHKLVHSTNKRQTVKLGFWGMKLFKKINIAMLLKQGYVAIFILFSCMIVVYAETNAKNGVSSEMMKPISGGSFIIQDINHGVALQVNTTVSL